MRHDRNDIGLQKNQFNISIKLPNIKKVYFIYVLFVLQIYYFKF